MICVAGLGELERVIVRACAGISDKGIQGSGHTVYTHIDQFCLTLHRCSGKLGTICMLGGHHMLHKIATISLLLYSYYIVNGLWVLLGAHAYTRYQTVFLA